MWDLSLRQLGNQELSGISGMHVLERKLHSDMGPSKKQFTFSLWGLRLICSPPTHPLPPQIIMTWGSDVPLFFCY